MSWGRVRRCRLLLQRWRARCRGRRMGCCGCRGGDNSRGRGGRSSVGGCGRYGAGVSGTLLLLLLLL